MGRISIVCCGEVIYYNYETKGGETGITRCPRCGCVYAWVDLGDGKTKTWTEQACPEHGFDKSKLILCSRCRGKGELYNGDICGICKGTGLVKIWV